MKKMIFSIIFVLVCAFVSPFAWAVSSFDITPEHGMIKEEFGISRYSSEGKTIVYIQDAHCNYEAQKNIANILEYLIKEHGIKMVFVEGGVEDSSLSFLRGYGSKKARKSIAEEKLREGKISGEEYLNIVSDLNFEIYGIEKAYLYNQQRNALLKVDKYKKDLLEFAGDIEWVTKQLKEKIYSDKLRDLEAKRKAYENNEITLISYIGYLNDLCSKHNVRTSSYFDFSRLAEAASLERTIYYDSIGKEANSLLNRIVENSSEVEKASLLDEASSLEGKGQKQVYDFYIKIRTLAERKYLSLEPYQNFKNFTTFLKAFDSVNMDEIFSDIIGVNRAITLEIVDTADQLDLVDIDFGLGLFKKIVNIKLDKSEFDIYKERNELIKPESWVKSLSKMASKYKVWVNLTKDTSKIEEAKGELERFYNLAFKRDVVFVEKIFSQMEEKGIDKAVLITGGFHSQNLQTLLEQGGARGVIVYPKVSALTDEDLYYSRVREELSDSEKLISGR